MNSSNRNNKSTTKEYEARLAGLYEEYYDRIAHYVYVRIGNRAEAEDIAGEVFLKALQSLKSYREQGIPIKQLTVEQREVINLRFFGGLTSKEVGDILNKSDGAVREMQRAAMEKLRGISSYTEVRANIGQRHGSRVKDR